MKGECIVKGFSQFSSRGEFGSEFYHDHEKPWLHTHIAFGRLYAGLLCGERERSRKAKSQDRTIKSCAYTATPAECECQSAAFNAEATGSRR